MAPGYAEVSRTRVEVAGHEAGHAVVAWHHRQWPVYISIDIGVAKNGAIDCAGATMRPVIPDRDIDVAISMAGAIANTDLQGVSYYKAVRGARDDFAELRGRWPDTDAWAPGFTNARRILEENAVSWARLRDALIDASVNGEGHLVFSAISGSIAGSVVTLRCSGCSNILDMDYDPNLRQISQHELLCGTCATRAGPVSR